MNIGIAVLTRNRRHEMAQVLDALEAHTKTPYSLAVHADRCQDDTLPYLEQRYAAGVSPSSSATEFTRLEPVGEGIAAGRNKICHHFRNHDVVFMFEDDFLPVRDGWESPYLRVLSQGTYPCLFALNPGHGEVLRRSVCPLTEGDGQTDVPILYRERVTTQMVAVHTSLLSTLGYFNPGYGTRYGFDDSEWASRGRDAGLFGSVQGFPCLEQESLFRDVANPSSSDGKTETQRQDDAVINKRLFVTHGQRPTFLPYPYPTPPE